MSLDNLTNSFDDPYKWCESILKSGNIEGKLNKIGTLNINHFGNPNLEKRKTYHIPCRDNEIAFSKKQIKFPKANSLKDDRQKGKALHFFANHELLAIEIMAYVVLTFPEKSIEDQKIKLGICKTIQEEQKHFKLYQKRMADFGVKFGDYPVNDFFWEKCTQLSSLKEYLAVMALTFENANLDFCLYYKGIFTELGDLKTANILDIVLQDEIGHVRLGVHWIQKWSDKDDLELWDYYQSLLPFPLTPARAKGIVYNREAREAADLPNNFIKFLEDYRDEFQITDRKSWKANTL